MYEKTEKSASPSQVWGVHLASMAQPPIQRSTSDGSIWIHYNLDVRGGGEAVWETCEAVWERREWPQFQKMMKGGGSAMILGVHRRLMAAHPTALYTNMPPRHR